MRTSAKRSRLCGGSDGPSSRVITSAGRRLTRASPPTLRPEIRRPPAPGRAAAVSSLPFPPYAGVLSAKYVPTQQLHHTQPHRTSSPDPARSPSKSRSSSKALCRGTPAWISCVGSKTLVAPWRSRRRRRTDGNGGAPANSNPGGRTRRRASGVPSPVRINQGRRRRENGERQSRVDTPGARRRTSLERR